MQDNQKKEIIANKEYFDKEDAYRTLELTNSWVNNVDTKISFALTLVGVLSAFIFTGGLPNAIKKLLDIGISLQNWVEVLDATIVALLYLASLSAILFLLLGMVARTKAKGDSLFFFGTIGSKKLEDYERKIQHFKEEHILKDLIEQIHTNSKICTRKMWFYNKGMYLLIVTVVLWFICMVFQLI